MSRIIISTESGSDLPWKISVPNCIEILPMHITFGRKMFYDGEFDVAEAEHFFKESGKLPVTSAPNLGEYSAHFRKIFRKYPDCSIIHIAYSSKLSVSYQNAVIASKEFPSSRLQVIVSQSGSIGAGALIIKACEIVGRLGKSHSLNECVSIICSQRKNVCCSFVPDSLDYLKAGGRISGITHLGASMLNIKPCITIVNGVLESGKKYRGSLYRIADSLMSDFVSRNKPSKDFIVIGYGYKINRGLLFSLKRQAHRMGFKKSWCFQIGSAVTAHTGGECIGFAAIG